jgi:ubiquinone/menaquinone biosynthesis C-methylase UbiE
MKRWIDLLPRSVRSRIKSHLLRYTAPTITEAWEDYARNYHADPGQFLGDEWNDPVSRGMDAPPGEFLKRIDQEVISPFFGTLNVILEIGSGGGRFTEILLPRCNRLIASEVSASMIKLLKQRFSNNPKIEYLLLDGYGLKPTTDNSIDAVFSYSVFVHIQYWDIYNYLTEVRRVLIPGGKAIIQHANTFSELGWPQFLKDVSVSVNRHKGWGTFTPMTPEMMAELVQRAGLRVVRCITDLVKRDAITLIMKPA